MTMVLSFLGRYWWIFIILFALWRVDANGYNRHKREAEQIEMARKNMELRLTRKMEQNMASGLAKIEQKTGENLARIDVTERTLQPIIQREIVREKRFSDPAAGISDGMLEALNRANCASHPSSSDCHQR